MHDSNTVIVCMARVGTFIQEDVDGPEMLVLEVIGQGRVGQTMLNENCYVLVD